MIGLIQPANSRTAMDVPTPNTNELCITLVADYLNGKIGKDNAVGHILEAFRESDVYKRATPVQIQTTISTYIGMLDQAESAWEVAALWGRGAWQVWGDITEEEQGGAQQALGPNPRTLELQLNMGSMNHKGLPIQKWAQEEGELMRQCSPGWEMKIQKLTCSPQVRNSPANSTKTRRSISKSQSITCSVQGGYQSFWTLSGSKYCRGRWLTLTLSSQWSTQSSLTTEQLRHLGTLNSNLDIQNQPKQLGTMGIDLLCTVHSSAQCSSSTPTESQNSYNTVSTSPLTLYPPMQEGKTRSSTSTRQSDWTGSVNNMLLDQFKKFRFLEVWHIFSKAAGDQGAQRNQWGSSTGQCGGVSTWWSKDLCQLFNQGKCGKQASEYWYRHVCIRCGKEGYAEKECTSKKAWVISCEGQETEACQEISMESQWVSDEELGPTAGYSLTAKPLPHPSPMAESDPVRQVMILNWPDLFKIICKIDINTFEGLLTHHPNWAFIDSVLVRLHEGFWPFADMMKEGYPKLWDGSWCLPKSEQECDFLEEQVWTEIAAEHFSELFGMKLLLRMYSPLVHAIPKPDSDTMCLVMDHSSRDFSPNSMILWEDVAGVWLNGLHTLGVSIMWSKHNCPNADLILYESDVSTTYRQLLMHPLYQILQIITVGDQRYIDRSNEFGGHASQIIWQSFMYVAHNLDPGLQVQYRHIEMLHQWRLFGC